MLLTLQFVDKPKCCEISIHLISVVSTPQNQEMVSLYFPEKVLKPPRWPITGTYLTYAAVKG